MGTSKRPVTLILDGGSCSTLLTWSSIFAQLASDYRVIAYERAGYGMSEPMLLPTLQEQVNDLVQLVVQIEGDPLILVGHSWGGLLAQVAMWECPSAVSGLVLLDPSHEEVWADESVVVHGPLISPGAAIWGSRLADLRSEIEIDAREMSVELNDDVELRARYVAAELSYVATDEQARIWFEEFPMMIGSINAIRTRRARAPFIDIPIELLTVATGPGDDQKVARHASLIGTLGDVHHVVVSDPEHNLHHTRPTLVLDSIRKVAARCR